MRRQRGGIATKTRSMLVSARRLLRALGKPGIELKQTQYDALRIELPALYGILIVNAFGLSATHFQTAPLWLAVYIPLGLSAACAFRIAHWLRTMRKTRPSTSPGIKVRAGLGTCLTLGYACWGWALYPYGDSFARCHVAVSVFLSVLGSVFCLAYLRIALAFVVSVSILPFVPFVLFSLRHQEYGLTAIATDLAITAAALAFILRGYYTRLADLTRSQREFAKKQEEAELLAKANFSLANVDALTLLPNRQRFFSDLDALLLSKSATHSGFAVGILDVDGLKPLTDLYGHEFRDGVLKEVGRRLMLLATPDVIIARTAERTFGLLVRSNVTASQLQDMGALIRTHLEHPYELSDRQARLSICTGFALYPDAGTIATQLYERAEFALRHARSTDSVRTVVVFSRDHEKAIKRQSEIEHHLRRANLDDELSVHFQPIFEVTSKGIVAFEALARWKSPVLGNIPPTDFLAIAERSHLAHVLTTVLLRKTLNAAAAWPTQIRVSFNLSARDLGSAEAIDTIISTVVASGISPHRINFEVTETALINDIDRAGEALLSLKGMGSRIYLDDFGYGLFEPQLHSPPANRRR